jgi:hypothetical protein
MMETLYDDGLDKGVLPGFWRKEFAGGCRRFLGLHFPIGFRAFSEMVCGQATIKAKCGSPLRQAQGRLSAASVEMTTPLYCRNGETALAIRLVDIAAR